MITIFPPISETNYEKVETFADLPPAEKNTDITYIVKNSSGSAFLFNKKNSGLYHSDGLVWNFIGNSVAIEDGIVSAESVWSSSKVSTIFDNIFSTKVDKVEGKDLSTNDFTTELKNMLEFKKVKSVDVNAMSSGFVVTYTDDSTNEISFPVPQGEMNYTEIDTYENLDLPGNAVFQIRIVKNATGTYEAKNRKEAGMYWSDSEKWNFIGNSLKLDDETTSKEATYSSSKIEERLDEKADAIQLICAEDIGGHRAVYSDAEDKVHIYNAMDFFPIVGVTVTSGVVDTPVTIKTSGLLNFQGWEFEVNAPVYVQSNGTLSTTVPDDVTYLVTVGVANSATSLTLSSNLIIKKG